MAGERSLLETLQCRQYAIWKANARRGGLPFRSSNLLTKRMPSDSSPGTLHALLRAALMVS